MSSEPAAHGIQRRGLLLVLSSPSGAGKTTISRALLQTDANLRMSVSVTTRPPRPGERDGIDYHFLTADRFEAMVQGNELLEHARVHGNLYGTPRGPVEAMLAAGQDVLFDIDWQGAQQLRERVKGEVASVFILPPSLRDLEDRLRRRAQDSEEVVARRMAKAMDEITHYFEYDYIIVNRDLDASIADVAAVLRAERLRRDRQVGLAGFVNRLRGAD